MDNTAPIITFEVSNAVLIFPNSLCVTCLTASDTPSPGSTIACDITSKYTPNAIIKQLITHSIHCSRYVVGCIGLRMYSAKSMKYPKIIVTASCIHCFLWNSSLSMITCISIKRRLNIIVIVPNDRGTAYFSTLGMHDIGVVPRSDITDSATPKDIMNSPIISTA